MSKEHFTTEYDVAMRTSMISIAEQLHKGSLDVYNAGLVELQKNGVSSAIPFSCGPSLRIEDMDSGSVFTFDSSLSRFNPGSRKMAFSASVVESEPIEIPITLLSPRLQAYFNAEDLTTSALKDYFEIRKVWAYDAYANQEGLDRAPYTRVTIGTSSFLLHPNASLEGRTFPLDLVSAEGLSQLPVPCKEELDVQRFNRIVKGLGFGAMQV